MRWTDVQEIAIALAQMQPGVDPRYVRYTDLHRWVMELEGFNLKTRVAAEPSCGKGGKLWSCDEFEESPDG